MSVDIFDKCKILMDHAARYPECTTIQQIVDKEISLNLHVLSGGNGEKFGYKKEDPMFLYESGIYNKPV